MQALEPLNKELGQNIRELHQRLPIGRSFDLVTRELLLGETKAYWIGVNGLCKTDLAKDWDTVIRALLSGPTILFVDGFEAAIILDVRNYPTRGVAEPDVEKVTRGARDGFVETLLFNCNLIRRRIRCPAITFEMVNVGSASRTDVAIAYVNGLAEEKLLSLIRKKLKNLQVDCLTMGTKSLEELLIPKKWYHPLPAMQLTERPDVAGSYLMEGHVLLIVDNTPSVLVLPCSIFRFTQSVEDYYKNPVVGNYFRLVRLACIPISLFLLPLFLLISLYEPTLAGQIGLIRAGESSPFQTILFVLLVELGLDLFRYSSAHTPDRFAGTLSIVGELIAGDVAISMNWASTEAIFYAAITMLATLSLASVEFGEGIRIYRLFLIVLTAIAGQLGLIAGTVLVMVSVATTPTFAGESYLWPLFPCNKKALYNIIFRRPTSTAQPERQWRRMG